jgi:hypothetical protein
VIEIRRDRDIYDIEGGWFHARWHFSFDHYRDPANDSFGGMRFEAVGVWRGRI